MRLVHNRGFQIFMVIMGVGVMMVVIGQFVFDARSSVQSHPTFGGYGTPRKIPFEGAWLELPQVNGMEDVWDGVLPDGRILSLWRDGRGDVLDVIRFDPRARVSIPYREGQLELHHVEVIYGDSVGMLDGLDGAKPGTPEVSHYDGAED
jgi:hypothetical protein